MARTQINTRQILDHSINRDDIDISTPGKALITKIIAGKGIILSSTGVDEGTGDVTISVSESPNGQVSSFYSLIELTSNKRFSTGTWITIPFNKIIEFENNFYDIENHYFDIPEDGYYYFQSSVSFNYYVYGGMLAIQNITTGKKYYLSQDKAYGAFLFGGIVLNCKKNDKIRFLVKSEYYNRELMKTYTNGLAIKL